MARDFFENHVMNDMDECQRDNIEAIFLIGCCLAAYFVIAVCRVIKQELLYREVAKRQQMQHDQQIEQALFNLNRFKINWNDGFGVLEE